MNISGNTVFIPGATSGIGLALATRLHAAGNTVIVGGRRADVLEQIARDHPGIDTIVIDTTVPSSILDAARDVIARHPDLNVLIPMAGIMRAEDWTSAGFLDTAEETVTTNLLGPIRLIAAFIDQLMSRPGATILTVSSGLAFTPLRVTPTYNATKAAIHMLSESIRLQLAGTGVQVQELVPPAVRTTLMPGHETSAVAMPLDAFADEVMTLLATQPGATEIQVESVKFLRYAETRGEYPAVVEALNAADPHNARP